jgi:hypothetical protein
MAGPCEGRNKLSGSIKGGKFLDWLGDCKLLKKDSAPWSYLLNWSQSCGVLKKCVIKFGLIM